MKTIKFPVVEEIQKLSNYAESLSTYFDRYTAATSKESCDKYDAKFNGDSRFTVFQLKANFCAHTGYYGNSGCTTFGTLDSKIIQKHFTEWLNDNKETIFKELSERLNNERNTLLKDANAEILEASEAIRKLLK